MKKTIILSSLLLTSTISFADEQLEPVIAQPIVAPVAGAEAEAIERAEQTLIKNIGERSKQSLEETSNRAAQVLRFLDSGIDLEQPIAWVYNGPAEHFHERQVVLEQPTDNPEEWLALKVGDCIFYRGAFGVKRAPHAGVVIGRSEDGKILIYEKWCQGTFFKQQGEVVISDLLTFRPGKLYAKSCKKGCLKTEKNNLIQIHHLLDTESGQELRLAPEQIKALLKGQNYGSEAYGLLTANCINKVSQEKGSSCASCLQTVDLYRQPHGKRSTLRSCKRAQYVIATTLASIVGIAAYLFF